MKKALRVIQNILVWLVVLITIGVMVFTIFSVSTFDRNDRNVFGYKFFIVQSDSMSATDFSAGDIVFVKETEPASLKEGDIIAYISQNTSNFGATVTHKIRSLVENENGEPGFITYGTTTNTDDEMIVTYPYVIGKYTGKLPKVGTFFSFLKTTQGYILCILIPFLLLIGYNGLHCIYLFRRYKQEQIAELQKERQRIEDARRQSEEILKELQDLRLELDKKSANQFQSDEKSKD